MEERGRSRKGSVRERAFGEANLLIYFGYRSLGVQLSVLVGAIDAIIRAYLWLMLLNVYVKSSVFSIIYLLAVLAFWFKPLSVNLVKDINKAAIIILVLQYVMLLLDINSATSPLGLPQG